MTYNPVISSQIVGFSCEERQICGGKHQLYVSICKTKQQRPGV